ncbi:MAG: hypothetical protein AB1696_02690 [Planctomycetota bacterium]
MAWAIRFIARAEVESPEGNCKEMLPPHFSSECLAVSVPEAVDLTAYSKQLAEHRVDRITIAQHGSHIDLSSMLVDSDTQGYFQFLGGQLWYKDGPTGKPSQNGTGILNPREEGGPYRWDPHDWTNVRNIFIPIMTYQIYMLFPGGVASKKLPSFLACVYHFQDQLSGTAQAQAAQQASSPGQPAVVGAGTSPVLARN